MSETAVPKLAAPARRALDSIGVSTLESLCRYTESEITNLHGMGPNAMRTLNEALQTKRLSFRPDK